MQEYFTRALVLDVDRTGEADARVVLFTEHLGKITARARSLFKPLSKLAAHVQPLTLTRVRLVEKNGVQLVDAMTEQRFITGSTPIVRARELLGVARLINELTHTHQPDSTLWSLIDRGALMSRELLRVLGFDPEHATCRVCRRGHPQHFILADSSYVCQRCFVTLRTGARAAVEISLGTPVVY